MKLFDAEHLYARLPAILRLRDGEADGALKDLIGILALQSDILEEDVRRLYDDQFIETCAPWLTPYIGDLIGYRPIHGISPEISNPRTLIAGEIARRRRKGTIVVLEQLARDATGWSAHAVEYFQRLIWTQNMNHVRTHSPRSPNLRAPDPLRPIDRAFDASARTVDVGRIAIGEGRHNVRNVGIHLWRLYALPIRNAPAMPLDARRWFFSPLGADLQLFSQARTETDISHLSTPLDVPDRITILGLHNNLEAFYPRDISIIVDGIPVPVADISSCNLADDGPGWAHDPASGVSIDPERGRIAFPSAAAAPNEVIVSYQYGFPHFIGGGSYERADSLDAGLEPESNVGAGDSLQTAIDARSGGGVVTITDSSTFAETIALNPDADVRLGLHAANEQRPALISGGDITITGGESSEVIVNGLLISGGALHIPADAGISRLILKHVTLVPGLSLNSDGSPVSPGIPSLIVEAPNVTVTVSASILGAVRCVGDSQVLLEDSIVDAGAAEAVAFSDPDNASAGGTFQAVDCTVIGKIHATQMPLVSNSILFARLAPGDSWDVPIRSSRRQIGCVRFSVAPPDALMPRRYRCLPDIAPAGEKRGAQPQFTDMRYQRPAYMQLARGIYPGIATGADDESEMGVWHKLFTPQRLANLRLRLEEYLPVGLEAGVDFET